MTPNYDANQINYRPEPISDDNQKLLTHHDDIRFHPLTMTTYVGILALAIFSPSTNLRGSSLLFKVEALEADF